MAIDDQLASPVPPLLFDFQGKARRDPRISPPWVDSGLPHLTGIAHNIRKGRGTTQIFSHISDGADFVMLGEVNKELDLPLCYSTGPRAARIFHNLGEGGTNGVALVVGPRLTPFSSPLPPPISTGYWWPALSPSPFPILSCWFMLTAPPPYDKGLQGPNGDCS